MSGDDRIAIEKAWRSFADAEGQTNNPEARDAFFAGYESAPRTKPAPKPGRELARLRRLVDYLISGIALPHNAREAAEAAKLGREWEEYT